MRIRSLCPISTAAALLIAAAPASAAIHEVATGESLSSVAAADGLTVSQLAAANGLGSSAPLISGRSLVIPSRSAALGSPGQASADSATPVDSGSTTSDSSAGGAYVVQPGDSLSAIAARAGLTVASLAAANGLDPNGLLVSHTVLQLSGAGSSGASSSGASSSVTAGDSSGGPYPTPETVSSTEVGSIAAAHGVPSSLAAAIGWQESGFNNDVVSPADARGVMQILPGTWSWIQNSLAGGSLSPSSASDNVLGGVLLLHHLLSASGGDPSIAAAGYYQGLASVRRVGMYRSTQSYVSNVLALRRHFGGP